MRRRSLTLVVASVFALALAARLAPLVWSPLPATLDGFRYATLARTSIETGIPWRVIDADELVFTSGLAMVSAVTGIDPLNAAQPFVASVGAAAPLVGIALARRLGVESDLDTRGVYLACVLAGVGLALEGLFVRRTGVPDEEAVGLLLVPLLALATHRWLADERPAWGVVTGVMLLVLPPLHNMSSMVGVLAVTALVALHAVRATSRGTLVRGAALGLFLWGYFLGYFEVAERVGLRITYSGLVRPYPGLFLAWVVVLVVGVVWLRSQAEDVGRATVLGVVGVGFLIVGVNAITPLFPGTVPSPPAVASLIGILVVPAVLAAVGFPAVRSETGPAVLAAFIAPVVFVYYALSASLTPDFFGAVLRIQGFAHLPAFVLAGVGTAALGTGLWRDRLTSVGGPKLRGTAIALLLIGVVLTVPLGYVNLDTGSYPSTTFQSEFEAVEFSSGHLPGTYATDHTLRNVDAHYVSGPSTLERTLTGAAGKGSLDPTRSWVGGGGVPPCPVLVQRSWTTSGVHLYPGEPGRLDEAEVQSVLEHRNVIYSNSGADPLWLAVPRSSNVTGC